LFGGFGCISEVQYVELDTWLKFGVPDKAKFIVLVIQINACQEIGMDSQLGIMD